MTTSRCILLILRNVSDKNCIENQITHFIFNNFFFEKHAVCKKMWKNIVDPDRLLMNDDDMAQAHFILVN